MTLSPRDIYARLRICGYFTIINKVYAGAEWIKVDSKVIGFSGQLLGIDPLNTTEQKLQVKALFLQRVRDWCNDRKLPVDIQDQQSNIYLFKIVILPQ